MYIQNNCSCFKWFILFQLKIELDEVFNESGANMSVISSSHCSDASEDGNLSNMLKFNIY